VLQQCARSFNVLFWAVKQCSDRPGMPCFLLLRRKPLLWLPTKHSKQQQQQQLTQPVIRLWPQAGRVGARLVTSRAAAGP
jgi:hypothetical protein